VRHLSSFPSQGAASSDAALSDDIAALQVEHGSLFFRKRSHDVSCYIYQHAGYAVKQESRKGVLGRLGPDEGPEVTIGDDATVNPESVDIVPVAAFVGEH
jgi:hypothetical protein